MTSVEDSSVNRYSKTTILEMIKTFQKQGILNITDDEELLFRLSDVDNVKAVPDKPKLSAKEIIEQIEKQERIEKEEREKQEKLLRGLFPESQRKKVLNTALGLADYFDNKTRTKDEEVDEVKRVISESIGKCCNECHCLNPDDANLDNIVIFLEQDMSTSSIYVNGVQLNNVSNLSVFADINDWNPKVILTIDGGKVSVVAPTLLSSFIVTNPSSE